METLEKKSTAQQNKFERRRLRNVWKTLIVVISQASGGQCRLEIGKERPPSFCLLFGCAQRAFPSYLLFVALISACLSKYSAGSARSLETNSDSASDLDVPLDVYFYTLRLTSSSLELQSWAIKIGGISIDFTSFAARSSAGGTLHVFCRLKDPSMTSVFPCILNVRRFFRIYGR